MTVNRRRLYLGLFSLAVLLLVYACLMTLFRSWVYELIIWPLHYAIWYINLKISSFPQYVFLLVLVVIGVFLALTSLPRLKGSRQRIVHRSTQFPETRFQHWLRWAREADQQAVMGKILAEEAREMVMQVLIEQEGLPRMEVEAAVEADVIAAPPVVKILIAQHRLPAYAHTPNLLERAVASLRQWLRLPPAHIANPRESARFDKDIREVIAFLEKRVEVHDDRFEH